MKFTVAIVTRNRSKLLGFALEGICLQTLLPDRVLVIDNASTDSTPEVCDSFRKRLNIERLVCPEPGVNRGRNVALENCNTTDILVFTDDDAVAEVNWLQSIADEFRSSPDAHAIQGVKENYYTESFAASLIQFSSRDLSMLRDRKGPVVLSANIVDTCNFAVRIDCVHEYNLSFDTSFIKGGDRHFGFQMIKAGLKIVFCETAIVRHRWEQSLIEYFKMRWRAGIAAQELRRRLGSSYYSESKVKISIRDIVCHAWYRSRTFGIHQRVAFLMLTVMGKCITSAAAHSGKKVVLEKADEMAQNRNVLMKQELFIRAYRALSNKIPRRIKRFFFRLITKKGQLTEYSCPLCSYKGPFMKINGESGVRRDTECPSCGSRERHRLLYLVLRKIGTHHDFKKMALLHAAPEAQFRNIFRNLFKEYLTVDLAMPGVDHKADLCSLPFPDKRFDIFIASHVLEHIKDDGKALREIRRILKPGGIALLPVPVTSDKTVEFDRVNLRAYGHVRSPGLDYFEKYRELFSNVELHSSDEYPDEHQTALYEWRKGTDKEFIRRPEFVPVCYR